MVSLHEQRGVGNGKWRVGNFVGASEAFPQFTGQVRAKWAEHLGECFGYYAWGSAVGFDMFGEGIVEFNEFGNGGVEAQAIHIATHAVDGNV